VLVDGGKIARFFKAFHPGAPFRAKAELQAFKKIAGADVAPDARICRLHGVVRNEDGLVMGMLLTYIEHDRTLSLAVRRDTPFPLRKQWMDQISETLAKLHQAGVVWGDAKPENVLVDTANNAWIVDFGGGYTPGWVDEDKAETIEGDLQGMANILTWILK
jgi:serine/threonine protein kinase